MNYIIPLLVLLSFTSCARDAERKAHSTNSDFRVEFIFECEGIKVYRFLDCATYHYFTSKGETMTTQKEFIGKHYSEYEENIK